MATAPIAIDLGAAPFDTVAGPLVIRAQGAWSMSSVMSEHVVNALVPARGGDDVAVVRESAVIRLVYMRKSNAKLWVQKIELKTADVNNRLFDVLLVSWGKSSFRTDLEFVLALDEDGSVLATIEGLTLYVAHSMNDARDDFVAAQMDEE